MINLPAFIQKMPNLVLEKPAFEAKLDLGLVMITQMMILI